MKLGKAEKVGMTVLTEATSKVQQIKFVILSTAKILFKSGLT